MIIRHVTNITPSHHTFKLPISIHNGKAGITVLIHNETQLPHCFIFGHRVRFADHSTFRALNLSNHHSLFLDGIITVNHTDTTFASQSNGKVSFGNAIHRC